MLFESYEALLKTRIVKFKSRHQDPEHFILNLPRYNQLILYKTTKSRVFCEIFELDICLFRCLCNDLYLSFLYQRGIFRMVTLMLEPFAANIWRRFIHFFCDSFIQYCPVLLLFSLVRVFPTGVSWWLLNGVWVTASLLKSS